MNRVWSRIVPRCLRVAMCVALMLLTAMATGSGCAVDEGELSGSLGEFYNLRCDQVRARLYDSELSIEYIDGATNEVSVRVTLRRGDRDPSGPDTVDLLLAGDVTGSSKGTLIPRFSEGTLRLNTYSPTAGAQVVGDFDVIFDVGTSEVALRGDFDTTLELVDF